MFLSMNETNISFIIVGHGLLDYISLTLKQFVLLLLYTELNHVQTYF